MRQRTKKLNSNILQFSFPLMYKGFINQDGLKVKSAWKRKSFSSLRGNLLHRQKYQHYKPVVLRLFYVKDPLTCTNFTPI